MEDAIVSDEVKKMTKFDLAVIGAGPGGYIAAIHAAKNGMKVALIERFEVGGACYNVGCIPSKIMLEHSKLVQSIERGRTWGIHTEETTIDFPRLMQRKDTIVQELLTNIETYIEKNAITFFRGEAQIAHDLTISVSEHTIHAKDIILATGSKPFVPPFKGLEEVDYDTTDTFFSITELPKQLTIIGGGVIAIEMAFALAPLGTKVTVLNHSEDILQTEEPDARPIIRQRMEELGIELVRDFTFERFEKNKIYTSIGEFPFEHVLFATGRRPNVELAESLALAFDGRLVQTNEHGETSRKHVFAIGDITGGFQLAHSASAEGVHVVDYLLGRNPKPVQQDEIPRCVYTHPEIATFGLLAHEVKEPYKMIELPLRTNPKALMEGNTEGFVKLIVSRTTQRILGACVMGDKSTELLNAILAAKTAGADVTMIANMIFPHPTMSEHIADAAREVYGQGIHI